MMSNHIPYHFPLPIAGEHIHSVLARYHVMLAKEDMPKTLRETLSGDRNLNLKSIWRGNFDEIWSFYDSYLGREQLLSEHTPFWFDAKFLPDSIVRQVVSGKLTDSISFTGIKNINYQRVWRWCPECVDENTACYGVRYWHVIHQLPSVISCPKHDLTLNYACPHCHFIQLKLMKYELPPRQNKCPMCKGEMEYKEGELSNESQWLQSLTLNMLSVKSGNKLNAIKTSLKKAIGLPITEFELSRAHRARIKDFQQVMVSSIAEGNYKPYFYFWSSNDKRVAIPYSINLIHLMYRDPLYPPLCYIAALRLCYSQQFIEALLVA